MYKRVLKDLHDRPTSGNFAGETKGHKIMRAGYYWPTLFRYVDAYVICWITKSGVESIMINYTTY